MASEKFLRRLEERRREQQEAAPNVPIVPEEFKQDIVTGFDDETVPRSEYSQLVDVACDSISFEEVFERLQGAGVITKTVAPVGAWRGDSNKFTCPEPAHTDKDPSAWGSRDKPSHNGNRGVWHCTVCGVGGDKYHLAGYLYGLSSKNDFPELRKRMSADFRGVIEPLGAAPAVAPPVVITTEDSTAASPEEPVAHPAEPDGRLPTYDWRKVLSLSPANQNGNTTFLQEFCKAVEKDTTPTEYNLFLGFQMLGLFAGHDIVAEDAPNVSAVFGLCLVGRTGTGKSRSTDHALALIRKVWPRESNGTGIHIHASVFSGQKIVDALDYREPNPHSTKASPVPSMPVPQRALFEYPEFSEIASAGAQQGSILKTKIHEMLDGKAGKPIGYGSMGAGSREAENPFASIITTTQTDRVRDLLKKSDKVSGFLNRFLFLLGQEKEGRARGRASIALAYAEAELVKVKEYCRAKTRHLAWDADADELLDKIYSTTIDGLKKQDTEDILTRLDLHFKRMVLAFAINERSETIQRHHVEMAAELIPYVVGCFGHMIGALLMTEDKELAEWLIGKIRDLEHKARAKGNATTPGPSGRDLRQYYKNKWDNWQVERALKSLVALGVLIKERQAGERGKGTDRYYAADVWL